ncbi:MAG: polysaccharide deacetylase family protein [Solirubrobacterales bacterium]|nr:polysaccharide deacetylase family protein [Solirubrobacterales bacterium]
MTLAAAASAATVLATPTAVGGAVAGSAPPRITAASLRQDGQNLIWFVALNERFPSFRALKRRHQTVCLLLEHPGGAVLGQLCAQYTRRGPGLFYTPIGAHRPSHFKRVAGTIARPNMRTLRAIFRPGEIRAAYHANLHWQTQTAVLPPSCSPTSAAPSRCLDRRPHHPRRLRLHVPKVVGCVVHGPEWVFNGPTNRRVIALTFDDGPWYDTPQFLSVLKREHVVATFFQIGDQISEYGGPGGAVERRILRDGDMIGDHTWSHPDVAGGGSFARRQIRSAALAIKRATGGFYPCLFRAPYGDVSQALLGEARQMGFTTIQWDVDPRDWSLPGVNAIYQNVVSNAHPGAIVIQHDGGGPRYETLQALPREINTLRARGYRFVTVTQLLGYRLIYK